MDILTGARILLNDAGFQSFLRSCVIVIFRKISYTIQWSWIWLIVILRFSLFLVSYLRPGDILLEPNGNLWEPEALVSTKIFQLYLCALDLVETNFLAHTREGASFGDLQALYKVTRHYAGVRLWYSSRSSGLMRLAAERAMNCTRGILILWHRAEPSGMG